MTDEPDKWMLVTSNGSTLQVRRVSEVLVELKAERASGIPLPHLNEILSPDDARGLVRDLLDAGVHKRTK